MGWYPAYIPYDSNRGWNGEWFYISNPMEASFPRFTGRRLKKLDTWSWGSASQQKKKVEIIEAELQKLVRCGLDGMRVFHTLFRHRVAPLAERTRSMWKYNGPMDPDPMLPEELSNDEVWSRLDRVLHLKPKEKVDGKPVPQCRDGVQTGVLPSLLRVLFPFALLFFDFEPPVS